jgi:hypothetical protein
MKIETYYDNSSFAIPIALNWDIYRGAGWKHFCAQILCFGINISWWNERQHETDN